MPVLCDFDDCVLGVNDQDQDQDQDQDHDHYRTIAESVGEAGDEVSDEFENDFVLSLDDNLLIEPRQVYIRTMLGEGSYSVVFDGLFDSQPVAVKIIQPVNSSKVRPKHKMRFLREVTLLSRMNHENILKLVGASTKPALFLVFELMKGGSLQRYLRSIRPKRLDLKVAIDFALDISRAMEYIHENGIVHRDLKPANLLLTEDKRRIKIGDFGLAREVVEDMTCEAGSYRWMAPELFSKVPLRVGEKKHYDHKADVYSFSIILWELITNEHPFKGRTGLVAAYAALARHERPSLEHVPMDLIPLLQSCWTEDPTVRPNFTEITKHLEKFSQKLRPTEATPPRILEIQDPQTDIMEEVVDELKELWPTDTTPPEMMEIQDPKTDDVQAVGDVTKEPDNKEEKPRRSSGFLTCYSSCTSD